ncbi:AAA-associated domain-containing protein [Candidatus Micrarchaeota archaeon]|nr:AAA-associated domain-containing protein [Candidatus Micrarchaeota archaeon]
MAKHSIMPIPDAMVGEVLGLAEIVYSYGGKIKVSLLSDELQIELDDLGDAIDMAELLKIVKVKKGEVMLTLYGEGLALGKIDDKKRILRDRISKIEMFKSIIKKIEKEKEIPEDELLEFLRKKYPIGDAEQFKKLLISWGGYTEIFEYYGNKGLFTLPNLEFKE